MIYNTSDERENTTVKQTHFRRKQINSISKQKIKKKFKSPKKKKKFMSRFGGSQKNLSLHD